MSNLTYYSAMAKALSEETYEGDFYILGQDVRNWFGAGKIYEESFKVDSSKIINTPISEAATAGIAIGLAMNGSRTWVEYSFADFVLHSMDGIINQAAKIPYLSDYQFEIPITFRLTNGARRGYGSTHSQSLEYMFARVPGLVVASISTPQQAYSVSKYCANTREPVILFDYKKLEEIEGEVFQVSNYKPTVDKISDGKDITVLSWGYVAHLVREVMPSFEDRVDALDLVWLNPIDWKSIIESVTKTKRVLVVEEGYGLLAGYIRSVLVDSLPFEIETYSLNSKFSPIPVNEILESQILIGVEDIKSNLYKLLA